MLETILYFFGHIGIGMLLFWAYQNDTGRKKKIAILDQIFGRPQA